MGITKNFELFKKELKTRLTEESWKNIQVLRDGGEAEVIIPRQNGRGWAFSLSAPEFRAKRAAQLIKISLGRPK